VPDIDRIAEITARHQAASRGPWASPRTGIVEDAHGRPIAIFGGGPQDEADTALIVHAHEDVQFLLDELARVQAAADELLAERDAARRTIARTEQMAAFYSQQAAS
jgi:hypothetical protein